MHSSRIAFSKDIHATNDGSCVEQNSSWTDSSIWYTAFSYIDLFVWIGVDPGRSWTKACANLAAVGILWFHVKDEIISLPVRIMSFEVTALELIFTRSLIQRFVSP